MSKNKILAAAKLLFLTAVFLLIVRNNSYPWFIKRSSDILFLVSTIFAAIYLAGDSQKFFWENRNFKKYLFGLSLIFSGLAVSSFSVFLAEGQKINSGGILEIGRFIEVATIVFLLGIFQSQDKNFYEKASWAQLSTLIYLTAFLLPNFANAMYRFQLFENWPSNVSYYLIVSLSFIVVQFMEALKNKPRNFFIWYPLAAGLTGILLWTQTRAGWLGAAASIVLIILFISGREPKKIFAGLALAAFLVIFGFSILPLKIKNNVVARIFPQLYSSVNLENNAFNDTIKNVVKNRLQPQIEDQRRIFLWEKYSKKLLQEPLGLGVNPNLEKVVGAVQGPHNTILEILTLAGPLGLGGTIYFFYIGFKNILEKIREGVEDRKLAVYICGALAGLIVASMFDNMSTFRLMWLVLGMAIFA